MRLYLQGIQTTLAIFLWHGMGKGAFLNKCQLMTEKLPRPSQNSSVQGVPLITDWHSTDATALTNHIYLAAF